MKFLVSVTGHLGCKFSDIMLVLYQKLRIFTHNRQNFWVDRPVGDPWPLTAPQSGGTRTAPLRGI